MGGSMCTHGFVWACMRGFECVLCLRLENREEGEEGLAENQLLSGPAQRSNSIFLADLNK